MCTEHFADWGISAGLGAAHKKRLTKLPSLTKEETLSLGEADALEGEDASSKQERRRDRKHRPSVRWVESGA